MQMCPKSPLLQTNFNLHQEKLNATENSKQSIYVRLDWAWRWLHHVAPCNAVRDDWCYTIKIWLTQPSGTADHFVRGPDFLKIFFTFWELIFWICCSVCFPCNLELETAIPTVLQNYGVRIFHFPWYLQHFALKLFMFPQDPGYYLLHPLSSTAVQSACFP